MGPHDEWLTERNCDQTRNISPRYGKVGEEGQRFHWMPDIRSSLGFFAASEGVQPDQ